MVVESAIGEQAIKSEPKTVSLSAFGIFECSDAAANL